MVQVSTVIYKLVKGGGSIPIDLVVRRDAKVGDVVRVNDPEHLTYLGDYINWLVIEVNEWHISLLRVQETCPVGHCEPVYGITRTYSAEDLNRITLWLVWHYKNARTGPCARYFQKR